MAAPELAAIWCGRESFDLALQRQLAAREALIAGRGGAVLFLVEHPPTLTIGRRGRREDILWSDAELAARGLTVAETPRGGEVTLHAPGQLVAYPVIHVGRQIRAHIVRMAEVTRELFESLGVHGTEFRMEQPGVWIGPRKLASIGIHISRGVAVQGISMNLDVEPGLFGALVSCGMPEVQMTSIVRLGGKPVSLEGMARAWAERFALAAGTSLRWEGEPPAADPVLS